jgi:hypothetical protein
MKFLAILPATLIAAAPAMAGPYLNIEANSGFAGGSYSGTTLDNHVGVEGGSGKVSWYVQGGPSVVAPEGGDSEVELSGKAGGSVAVSDSVSVYGEVSFITAAENGYGTKAGLKYKF